MKCKFRIDSDITKSSQQNCDVGFSFTLLDYVIASDSPIDGMIKLTSSSKYVSCIKLVEGEIDLEGHSQIPIPQEIFAGIKPGTAYRDIWLESYGSREVVWGSADKKGKILKVASKEDCESIRNFPDILNDGYVIDKNKYQEGNCIKIDLELLKRVIASIQEDTKNSKTDVILNLYLPEEDQKQTYPLLVTTETLHWDGEKSRTERKPSLGVLMPLAKDKKQGVLEDLKNLFDLLRKE